ncbi:aldolase/citrate lyase family protein [Gynuella sunshinyii]|uniref:2,4-dihydroxyhept-2-ene-1,7-dioic acid aldolase n=1 Tax=Gynuella sunshinyii YC6258 TaxID=1445510 RepID=A0A0C5VEF9_9GAMM|nr:HpcH/HpaI aldolase/citrate lyase family protein [Gynuella sunshinyii]AJQ97675.1 2,4-dihydroxyhept-2-ene-1,7-dioic acid aldolase [Gynuella sunshinyii YC6258]
MIKTPKNPFKQALHEGRQQYGYWLGLCSPLSSELCGYCGYDWLLIDAEHAPNDLRSIHAQLLAIATTPSHAVVRIVEGRTALIKQMLDLGAQTLLVPMVETAEQARELVRAVHYPPDGVRGVGTALARAARWNQLPDYFAEVDQELCLLIQVESVTALEQLDDILSVEGVDGVFIGPADLAATMGHLGNPAHPDVKQAVETAIDKIRKAGKAAGTLVTSPALAQHYEQCGAQFLALGVDTLALAAAARNTLATYKSSPSDLAGDGNGGY